mmetsp:Transcript_11492/g.11012  ORF Transcript_11492/g.11012 Transcript_11492/m.11012 type:complete len:207 (-) Transcript_11492:751-1371(-)
MYWVYASVRNQEKAMNKYTMKRANSTASQLAKDNKSYNTERSKVSYNSRIRMQALCYVGAFLLAWFFPTVFQLVIVIGNIFPWWLLFLTAFFVPCQGILNLLVFLRPRYLKYRQSNTDKFALVAWFIMLKEELVGKQVGRRSSASTTYQQSQAVNQNANDSDGGGDEEEAKEDRRGEVQSDEEQKKQEDDELESNPKLAHEKDNPD